MIRITRNKRRKKPRFAVVISKKVHKSAVGRNRARRRVYEIIRYKLPDIKNAYDVILTIKSAELINAPHESLQGQIDQLFQKGGVYANTEK